MRSRAFIIFIGCIAPISCAIAGPTPVSNRTAGSTTEPVISSPGAASDSSAGTQAAPGSSSASGTPSSQSNSSASGSSDGESDNVAGVDADGLPVLKRKPAPDREKVVELKDGQKLPTSGVDPKFQGSLLNTSVDSIASVSPQADKNRGVSNKDPRLKGSDSSLTKNISDPQKKNGASSARSDASSSPSPTPSATASPTAKASSNRAP